MATGISGAVPGFVPQVPMKTLLDRQPRGAAWGRRSRCCNLPGQVASPLKSPRSASCGLGRASRGALVVSAPLEVIGSLECSLACVLPGRVLSCSPPAMSSRSRSDSASNLEAGDVAAVPRTGVSQARVEEEQGPRLHDAEALAEHAPPSHPSTPTRHDGGDDDAADAFPGDACLTRGVPRTAWAFPRRGPPESEVANASVSPTARGGGPAAVSSATWAAPRSSGSSAKRRPISALAARWHAASATSLTSPPPSPSSASDAAPRRRLVARLDASGDEPATIQAEASAALGDSKQSCPLGRGSTAGPLTSDSCSGRPETPSGASDVERLIARCMTHERPTALVKATAALLDAASAHLGEEGQPGEKRSDKIRRMLRLTDELRRYNAGLTAQDDAVACGTEHLTTDG